MRQRWARDAVVSSITSFLFSVALGFSGLVLPLLAVGAGYGAVQVGLLYSASAVTSIITRMRIGTVLRRIPDRTVLAIAAVALSSSFLLALISSRAAMLATAWAIQGFARAFFWTGSQTHVVRRPGAEISALATLNVFASIGLLVGPVLAGALIEVAITVALVAGFVVSLAALGAVYVLDAYPPFGDVDRSPEVAMWRRVAAASGAGVSAGSWRGLLESIVPVVLQNAAHSASTTGVLIGAANAAGIAGAAAVGRVSPSRTRTAYVAAMLCTATGVAVLGVAAPYVVGAAAVLGLAGLGAGVLQTLAPALAALSVLPDERGDAIATAGIMRTVAMSVAPLAASGALVVLAVAPALLITGIALALPVAAAGSLREQGGAA